MTEQLMTTKQVATRWRTSTRKVHEAVHQGKLRAVQFNERLWRYHPDDVQEAERKMGSQTNAS